MQNFTKLKYAELRKLAKKAGIKANLKHEKLVAELTKFYEKDEVQESQTVATKSTPKTPTLVMKHNAAKSTPKTPTLVMKHNAAKSTPKTPTLVMKHVAAKSTPKTPTWVMKPKTPLSVPKPRTPILVAKRQISATKSKTPATPNQQGKPTTPNQQGKPTTPNQQGKPTTPNQQGKPTTPNQQSKPTTPNQQGKPTTPGSAKPVSRWEKRVFSPATAVRPDTPTNKPITPASRPATPTIKPATPVRKSATPQNRLALAKGKPTVSSLKRKQTDTPDVSQPAKKRRSTFEKAPTPDLNSPQIDKNNTNKRRSTFEKAPTPNLKTPEVESSRRRRSGRQSAGSSQSVTEMLGAMKGDMNAEEMKKSLLSVLDKNVQEKVKAAPAPGSTSIPRFAAFVKKRQEAKPITPGNKNWDKIHKKNFDKFDSIDVYLNKKRKRADEMTASVKKAKTLLSEVRTAVDKLKSHKTPETNENKFIKPRVSNANKTTPFKPTVLNTTKMNLNFGTKKSPKTLPRNPIKPVISSTVKRSQPAARKSTGSVAPRKSMTTPFKFTGNTSSLNYTLASTKKSAFDLKASLARPITWKTHKGKLKPLEASTKSPVYNKTLSAAKGKKNREVTRTNVAKRRADKKNDARMARRGIKI